MRIKRTLKKHLWLVIGAVAVILIGGSMVYANYAEQVANKGVTFSPHIQNPNATVSLTEYSDFACPSCEAIYPTVASILKKYGDKIKFEYKYFPLINVHPNALIAARAAEAAAQQGKFFPMYDQLFQNSSQWVNAPDPTSYFIQYAQTIGLNVPQFKRQLGSTKIKDKILQDYQADLKQGLTSTPTFYLNGQKLTLTSPTQFEALVAAAVNPATSTAATSGAAATTGGVQFGL